MTKEEEGFLSAQADRFPQGRNDGRKLRCARGSGLVMAREDADWSLKMEGLRGMLRPARLAESPDPDARTKEFNSKFPKDILPDGEKR